MKPKGVLLIIGGAEDKGEEANDMENRNIRFKRYEILKTLLKVVNEKPIEIITTASKIPNEIRKSYERAFHKIGHDNIDFIDIRRRSQVDSHKFTYKIEKAGAVFFSGGDQARLSHIFSKSHFIKILKYRYYNDPDFLLGGTSAGAMVLSDIMIKEGGTQEAMIANNLKLSKGLDIIPNVIIDTHFIKRGRFGRLAQAITMHPNHIGIGLGEDTALIIRNGILAECHGSGMVGIIDGRKIYKTNIGTVKEGEPIFVENLTVHLYVKGSTFSLQTKK